MAHTIMYDDLTGERMLGEVAMYKGIRVCLVGAHGVISMNMPSGWVTSHKEMIKILLVCRGKMCRVCTTVRKDMCITIIMSDQRPLWAIKAQFSTKPNWASKTMVFFRVYCSVSL